MVNTWSQSYFGNEGIRVLFVMPQAWTDSFIPLEINPKPAQIVRVMVGRLELLTSEREQKAEKAQRCGDAGDGEQAAPAVAQRVLEDQRDVPQQHIASLMVASRRSCSYRRTARLDRVNDDFARRTVYAQGA